jgi:methionyl aminopeptidase
MANDAETSLRLAAEIHKQVRRDLRDQNIICSGAKMIDIAEFIEKSTRCHTAELIEKTPIVKTINGGIGFPVGLSVNSCAAHYHPHSSDQTILSNSDILKVDFGTEINGWIVDSAFTQYGFCGADEVLAIDETYENLTACMRDATNTGIKNIGIDAPIVDWSKSIEEVMRAYDIHPITNLGGHNILHEIIHGDKFLPACVSSVRDANERFCAGVYAIETFGSTDANYDTNCEARECGDSTIFRLNPGFMKYSAASLSKQFHSPIFNIKSVQNLFSLIKTQFKTLPFAERYLTSTSYRTPLALLVKHDVLYSYPPLHVAHGHTAQFEHTIMLKENGSPPIVFSRSDDY